MRGLAKLLTLMGLCLITVLSHAALTSARARALTRFKKRCDAGVGKACYDYGRALWSTPGYTDRKSARAYLLRGCELKYQVACDAYHDHNISSRTSKHPRRPSGTSPGAQVCFSKDEMKKAAFSPLAIPQTPLRGQKINLIQLGSFWARVGLKENDIILRVNNGPFNTSQEALKILSTSGKKFAFEVWRDNESTTLWYTCN